MNFQKFADLMKSIGFRGNEPLAPIFRLNRNDLKNRVFRGGYSKVPGHYQVVSIFVKRSQGIREVALWAKRSAKDTNLFPFLEEEVDFLAKKKSSRN